MRGLEVQLYWYPHKTTMLFNDTSKIIRESRTHYKVCNKADSFTLSILRPRRGPGLKIEPYVKFRLKNKFENHGLAPCLE